MHNFSKLSQENYALFWKPMQGMETSKVCIPEKIIWLKTIFPKETDRVEKIQQNEKKLKLISNDACWYSNNPFQLA